MDDELRTFVMEAAYRVAPAPEVTSEWRSKAKLLYSAKWGVERSEVSELFSRHQAFLLSGIDLKEGAPESVYSNRHHDVFDR